MKRIFDLLFSIIVLLLFFPIGVLIASCIIFDSKGGVFYKQERVGKDGKLFYLLKFRSMYVNSSLKGTLTVGDDSRITRVGSLIRKLKLDEFPQFLNVVLGDMSIVGPRPEVPEFVALYSEEQRRVLSVRPGITDEASLAYFEESKLLATSTNPKKTYIEEIMPAKITINLAYLENRTLLADFSVIGKTFLRIFRA
jgi:lipopolysaccharide/colanic/teichoic acid biosynthesis glycosyltransferase